MAEDVLVINVGSSSVKAAILRPQAVSQRAWSGRAERIGGSDAMLRFVSSSGAVIAPTSQAIPDHATALELLLDAALGEPAAGSLVAVGHRVVHGGPAFSDPVLIDEDVVGQLEQLVPLAPLHMPQSLAAIAAARRMLPGMASLRTSGLRTFCRKKRQHKKECEPQKQFS